MTGPAPIRFKPCLFIASQKELRGSTRAGFEDSQKSLDSFAKSIL